MDIVLGNRVVKLRSSEHGLLLVGSGKDPRSPPNVRLEENIPRIEVEVKAWGNDEREVKKFLRGKLEWKLREEVAKLFREFLDPKREKSVGELARYHVDVEVTPRGSVHATLYVLDEIAREVLESFLKEAEEGSYGIRKLFDLNANEEQVEKELRFYLKRSNVLLPDVLEQFGKRLVRQGVNPNELYTALMRVVRILRRFQGETVEAAVARAVAPHVEKVARSFLEDKHS